jgi:zinc transport system substrate-binding protein
MKNIGLIIAIVVVIISAVVSFLVFRPAGPAQPSDDFKLKVAGSIFPVTDIIRNIAKDKVEVVQLLPPGVSEHTFELTVAQRAELIGVDLGVIIGSGLDENWANSVFNEEGAEILDLSEKINLLPAAEHEHEHEEGEEEHEHEGEGDPHYWLSVNNAKIMAITIADKLIDLDPANELFYRDNLENYSNQLDQLKANTVKQLENLKTREIITFHEAFNYFANEFGLEVVATIEPFPGKEPTPQYLSEVVEIVNEKGIKVLFKEPQLSDEVVKSLAEDYDITVFTLDPVGGIEERTSYIELISFNSRTLAEALK